MINQSTFKKRNRASRYFATRLILLLNCYLVIAVSMAHSQTQQRILTGRVSNASGGSLPGVAVIVKGTTNGTTTDAEGIFTLSAPQDAGTLVFSFIGLESKEVEINNQTNFDIVLEELLTTLGEVVVVGYGEQSRGHISTAISKVDGKVLQSVARSNVGTALQGTVAGLRVQNTTGQPGATPAILLRGGTDWSGGSAPLVIVDGIISSLNGLNADDIESIEVLKDAAATAIYGARGANGIILITTKRGKPGTAEIKYTYRFAKNQNPKMPEMLSARDYIYMNRMGLVNYRNTTGKTNFDVYPTSANGWGIAGNMTNSVHTTQLVSAANRQYLNDPAWQWMVDPLNPNDTLLFQHTDFSEIIFGDSYAHEHHLSVSGGGDKGQYAVGVGVKDHQGLIIGSEFKSVTVNQKSSYNVGEKVRISSIINFVSARPNNTYFENIPSLIERISALAPTMRLYNSDGSIAPGRNSGLGNPAYYKDKFIRKRLEQRFTIGGSVDWSIIPDLTLTVNGSVFGTHTTEEAFDKSFLNNGNLITEREAAVEYARGTTQQYNALLSYSKTFNKDHNINLLLGEEFYSFDQFNFKGVGRGAPTNLIRTLNASAEPVDVSSSVSANRILSTLGRVSYDFKSRYLFNFNFRYDGSSKLANNKYGFFPGVSVGWNMHDEHFFADKSINRVVSTIKPRVSYGVNGNVDNLSNFGAFGGYGQTSIYFGERGYFNNSLPTLDLMWESSTTLNVGADIGFLNNRITLLVDVFQRDIYNKLAPYALPFETGFSSITTNNGTLRNRGIEAELKANILDTRGGFRWNVGGVFYRVRNYVIELPDNGLENNRQGGIEIYDPSAGKVVWAGGLQEGKPLGTEEIFSHQMVGIYRDQASVDRHSTRVDLYYPKNGAGEDTYTVRFPGDVEWRDVDKNDTIDYRDRVYIGRSTPSFMGGFSTDLSWKGFTLNVFTDFGIGHHIFNNPRVAQIGSTQGSNNSPKEVLNSWTPENPNAPMERFDFTDPRFNHGAIDRPRQNSSYWERGDYLAIREVTLSYDFPATRFTSYVKALRLYASGANLGYITRYSGMLPEVGGVDMGRYPMPKMYTMGLTATF